MFQFKRFSVYDEQSTMKVGTDAVLLACWTNTAVGRNILEIGCGCGVISLILAQRIPEAIITAIDIDEFSTKECFKNFQISPWSDRLLVKHSSLQDFERNSTLQFDLIVSNPPFFNDSLKSVETSKKRARHTDELSYDELISSVSDLLTLDGRFCCVLPFQEMEQFIHLASFKGLYCLRQSLTFTKENKLPKRCLMEFSKREMECEKDIFLIQNKDGEYTSEYLSLTSDFYLFA